MYQQKSSVAGSGRERVRGRLPRLLAVTASVALMATLAACGSSDDASSGASTTDAATNAAATVDEAARALLPEDVKSRGTLRDSIQVPTQLEFAEAGSTEFKGFDVDFARELAGRLGLELELSSVAFSQLLPSLTTGRADVVISSLMDKKERFPIASFVDYFKSGAQLYTSEANVEKIPDFAALCGQTVEVTAGSAYAEDVANLSAKTCAGKDPIKVIEVGETTGDAVLQIKTGRALAAVDTVEAFGKNKGPELEGFVPVGDPLTEAYYGVAIKHDNDDLLAAVEKAFAGMLEDGTYRELLAKWGLEAAAVDAVRVNTGS